MGEVRLVKCDPGGIEREYRICPGVSNHAIQKLEPMVSRGWMISREPLLTFPASSNSLRIMEIFKEQSMRKQYR